MKPNAVDCHVNNINTIHNSSKNEIEHYYSKTLLVEISKLVDSKDVFLVELVTITRFNSLCRFRLGGILDKEITVRRK